MLTSTPQSNPITGQVHLSSLNLSSLTAATDYVLAVETRVLTIATSGS